MNDQDMVKVPRELLDKISSLWAIGLDMDNEIKALRAILAQPVADYQADQQPVGYATQSDLDWQGDIVARRYRTEHYTVPLYTLPAQGDDT